jgi:ubiquitin-protein ligase
MVQKAQTETFFMAASEDLRTWKGFLTGPKDTPYEGGMFEIEFYIPDKYPIRPPEAKWLTK